MAYPILGPQRPCRLWSYLATAHHHGRHPFAIRDALNGTCCHCNGMIN